MELRLGLKRVFGVVGCILLTTFQFLLAAAVLFLLLALLLFILVYSSLTVTVWILRTKRSRRAAYRKWLRKELRRKLKDFRGYAPLVLHISGPSGFDWRSAQHLAPGIKPEWGEFRPVPVGSKDWHGYVHHYLVSVRYKFRDEEIFPMIGMTRTLLALMDL